MKIVSACLAGVKCRYNGEATSCKKVIELVKQGKAISVCPEQMGGLPTPRDSAEKIGNKFLTKNGEYLTAQFKKGAKEVLKIAKKNNIKEAILKSKSPSCGCGKIYDGTFSGKLIAGDGITTTLLKKNGIKVISEEEL
jgi:uncharacterized protein YbbK (DUF523 family)